MSPHDAPPVRQGVTPVTTERYNGRLYAELHLHLGGAILPRILYVHLQRKAAASGRGETGGDPLLESFPDYDAFEAFFRRPRRNLESYLEMHKLVERIQRPEAIADFVFKLVRGAYLFEERAYIELRHCPYFRTEEWKPEAERIREMERVVQLVAEGVARAANYPVVVRQILCMHSMLPGTVNEAIVDLAAVSQAGRGGGNCPVVAVDLAGPDVVYRQRLSEIVSWYERARAKGLKTTGHLYETPEDCHEEILPYLDRIGHGIQIPLRYPDLLPEVARRGQCLEVCPTSYLKTGTLQRYDELKPVFDRCADTGVDVVLCTDNAGLHMTRLPAEFENLLIHEVIEFGTMLRCQDAAFKHAFAWPFEKPARELARAVAPVPG
jgi:adenosine deaminase